MSKVCQICHKSYAKVNRRKLLRGNMNPTCKRRQKPNLQKAIIDGKKVLACTKCIKSQSKTKR